MLVPRSLDDHVFAPGTRKSAKILRYETHFVWRREQAVRTAKMAVNVNRERDPLGARDEAETDETKEHRGDTLRSYLVGLYPDLIKCWILLQLLTSV